MNAINVKVKRAPGFTLIELMIVVAIVAILAAIALPAYGRYVLRSGRVEAKTALNFVMQAQERYFSTYNRYSPVLVGPQPAGLGLVVNCGGGINSENCNYRVTVEAVAGDQNITLVATPIGRQASDICGPLRLSAAGVKLPAPVAAHTNGACW